MLGMALLGAAVLVAAGLLGYAMLHAERPAPVAAQAPDRPVAAPRMDTALRAGPPPGVETAALPPAPPIAPQPAASLAPTPARQAAPAPASVRVARPSARKGCGARAAGLDRLLCRDADLAALDRELNQTYAEAVRSGAPVGQMAEEHEAWVIRRDRAARDSPDTVADLYQERIARLRAEGQAR